MKTFGCPTPRPAIADAGLVRPDWTVESRRDPGMLWLDKNENTDPELIAVVAQVVAGLPNHAQHAYPESGPLYHKLAAWLSLRPENLLLAAGSDGAIRAAFEAFVSPGEVVIHTGPTFAMYGVYCRMYGAEAHAVDYRPSEAGPLLDVENLLAAIGDHSPRLVCLPNPDSPTGTVFDQDAMRAIIEAAGAVGAVMLVDEAYHPFHADTVLPWIKDYPHLMVTRSTGKAWGLAGFRIGYAAAAPDLTRTLHKVKSMYETGTMAMAVFEAMLDRVDAMEASVRRLLAGKALFAEAMRGLGLDVLEGNGNFIHVAFGPHAEDVHAALADIAYYRRDSAEPCLAGFSRFTVTTPELLRPVIDSITGVVRNGA